MLEEWIIEALRNNGGKATPLEVAKYIWINHSHELQDQGDLFYSWQYRMRWAAHALRKQNMLKPIQVSIKCVWELT